MERDFLFMGSWSFHSEISETNETGCPSELRYLSAAIPGGGGNPEEIRGDWAGFVNLSPGWGGLDCFCTFVAGSPGEDPRD